MTTEQPAILLTSADVQNIENDRNRISAEIVSLESKLVELQGRRGELTERLNTINALLNALGLSTLSQAASNSVYAARSARVVPGGNGHSAY